MNWSKCPVIIIDEFDFFFFFSLFFVKFNSLKFMLTFWEIRLSTFWMTLAFPLKCHTLTFWFDRVYTPALFKTSVTKLITKIFIYLFFHLQFGFSIYLFFLPYNIFIAQHNITGVVNGIKKIEKNGGRWLLIQL